MKKKANKTKKAAASPTGLTMVSLLLDETGSMMPTKGTTISGFNEYLSTLRKDGNRYLVTLTLFNSERVEVRHLSKPPSEVPDLTDATYQPNAMTPLYDAIGKTITALDRELRVIVGKPNVVMVIMTDGLENASHEWTKQGVQKLIMERRTAGWNFIYLGANQDAWEEAGQIGISMQSAVAYDASRQGIAAAYHVAARSTQMSATTSGGTLCSTPMAVSDAMKEMTDEDKASLQYKRTTTGSTPH